MSRAYIVTRNGGTVTKAPINDNKIPIYANETALDADLANIPDNTLVATKSGHDDVIDQMKAYIHNQISPDWANAVDALNVSPTSAQSYTYTATEDGWLAGYIQSGVATNFVEGKINGVVVFTTCGVSNVRQFENSLFVKINKGDVFEVVFPTTNGVLSVKFVPHK